MNVYLVWDEQTCGHFITNNRFHNIWLTAYETVWRYHFGRRYIQQQFLECRTTHAHSASTTHSCVIPQNRKMHSKLKPPANLQAWCGPRPEQWEQSSCPLCSPWSPRGSTRPWTGWPWLAVELLAHQACRGGKKRSAHSGYELDFFKATVCIVCNVCKQKSLNLVLGDSIASTVLFQS